MKTPHSGNMYFDFTIQESVGKTPVMHFSPNKHENIKEKEVPKTPVCILNVNPKNEILLYVLIAFRWSPEE